MLTKHLVQNKWTLLALIFITFGTASPPPNHLPLDRHPADHPGNGGASVGNPSYKVSQANLGETWGLPHHVHLGGRLRDERGGGGKGEWCS